MDIEAKKEKLALAKQFAELLEKEIAEEEAKSKIGFEDDPIFLLSVEEYERFKDVIDNLPIWWWLRSPSHDYSDYARDVDFNGYADYSSYVNCTDRGVRPVINLNKVWYGHSSYFTDLDGVKKVNALGTTWIRLTADYYIAENPIAFRKFDEKSNNYEYSEIRQFLREWFEIRNA